MGNTDETCHECQCRLERHNEDGCRDCACEVCTEALDARCAECGSETEDDRCEWCSLATGLDPVELEPRSA